jgi:cytochrome P450
LFTSKAVEGLRKGFVANARTLIGGLTTRRSIDAVADLAEAYPLKVFPDAVGLNPHERGRLLEYGRMVFNGFGPRNRLFAEAFAGAAEVQQWIVSRCRREALSSDGIGAKVYAAVDAGSITEDEAGLLVRSLLSAGVDTTAYALGIAVHALATHPDQWAMLRAEPALARSAFDEAIRYGSPVQTFFRTTTRDVDVDGVMIPAGEKVLLFLGAANRDPRRWERPGRFEITRRTGGHVGFGMGVHGCLGMAVARMQGDVLLGELARRVSTVELAGAPVWRLNNTLRGYGRLPVTLTPAAGHGPAVTA